MFIVPAIEFPEKLAVNPVGKPIATPIFVAPVVRCVIVGINAVLMHNVGELDAELAVILGVTVIVPVAFTVPHPPVNGIE
jgi:hypothetical protein